MNTVLDDLERELRRAVAANARRRKLTLPTRRRLERHRPRLAATALGVALLASATALAAGGVIKFGWGVPDVVTGIEARSGHVVPRSVALLPVRSGDPAGGLPWGMRTFDTGRGEGCLEVGRLDRGKLGGIGIDGAFRDDSLFHPFAADTFGAEKLCAMRDGGGRLFLNGAVLGLPASAWTGEHGNNGCVASGATPYERNLGGREMPTCPRSSERDVYFGVLGPRARSISYVAGGATHTLATSGADGAYLLVLGHGNGEPSNFLIDSHFSVAAPARGPIVAIHYGGGKTCTLVAGGRGALRCASGLPLPVGWVAPKWAPSEAAAAAPVAVRLVRVHGAHGAHGSYEAIVSFRAKVAIANARSYYLVEWHEADQQGRVHSFGPPLPLYPKRGQRVRMRLGRATRLHPGRLTGKVILGYEGSDGRAGVKRVVGGFAITVPR